jgi:hypothetical protein
MGFGGLIGLVLLVYLVTVSLDFTQFLVLPEKKWSSFLLISDHFASSWLSVYRDTTVSAFLKFHPAI